MPHDIALTAILQPTAGACGATGNNTFCSPQVTPQISIKNFGTATLTSLAVKTQVDNGTALTYNWTGSLAPMASTTITLNTLTAPGGNHHLKIYVTNPNGATDGRNNNDTLNAAFSILAPIAGPVTEGFESVAFAPAGWQLINGNTGSLTWERTTAGKKSGNAAARIRFYDYDDGDGQQDYLLSPVLDVQGADSVILSFERAYKAYSPQAQFADSLAIMVSFDCGATYTEVWKRGGVDLSSTTGTSTTAFVPTAADWLHTRINLKPFLGNASRALVAFKTISSFGNNLYIDDVNIAVHTTYLDAAITAITEPTQVICTRNYLPSVTLTSRGTDTIRTVKVLFRVNNNELDSVQWTGKLGKGQSAQVALKNLSATVTGRHTLTVYTKQPNGQNEPFPGNDTSRLVFTVSDPQVAPLTEGFETAAFPHSIGLRMCKPMPMAGKLPTAAPVKEVIQPGSGTIALRATAKQTTCIHHR
ncbi:choice-of-anchor J domain-containing protein [Paraflavitalea speifideaquila]|uniref:choice-of-anchor J domain-containing protein n=1 Tax=Paraflavitalea speifideaquila TaxID=3076558 RepID=UPI0028E99EF9|nr:choice-of-anchor J domain-containing protein [Paraflavitalea speifideiaquila]